MIPLIILGAAGTARDVLDWIADLAEDGRAYECIGLFDDDPAKIGTAIGGVPVLGPVAAAAAARPDARVANALGGPGSFRRRRDLLARSGVPESRFETLVHPLARISPRARIGPGVLAYPFAFVGPDTVIGAHATLLSHVAVNHDARVGTGAILASHVALAGNVEVGEWTYLGMGAQVRQGARVGAGAMVGMGSVVLEDVAPGTTVAGVPARPIGPAAG